MHIHSINLIVTRDYEILSATNAPLGKINPGNYVAVENIDQQKGCYSLYEADIDFVKGKEKIANIYISTDRSGNVTIEQ